MRISEIITTLGAEVLTEGADTSREVHAACGSDMMSDVLAYVKDQGVLITGLTNPQVVRTASMMDMVCIVFVRGKRPDNTVLQLAEEFGIIVLATQHTMYNTCGMLYEKGLHGGNNTAQ
ncbi:hypothetical protein LJC04_01865 [Ruminococcaceae bacterium OttesenSCG-928-O06]|nr:hypothetical protein [Ruminococcaceae bacterium OttesenSCG-928-O06]